MYRTVSTKLFVITLVHILQAHVLIRNEERILYSTLKTASLNPCVISPVHLLQPHVVIRNERRISYLTSGAVSRKPCVIIPYTSETLLKSSTHRSWYAKNGIKCIECLELVVTERAS